MEVEALTAGLLLSPDYGQDECPSPGGLQLLVLHLDLALSLLVEPG